MKPADDHNFTDNCSITRHSIWHAPERLASIAPNPSTMADHSRTRTSECGWSASLLRVCYDLQLDLPKTTFTESDRSTTGHVES